MYATMLKTWKSFKCPKSELNLNIVLACGQSFRWWKNTEDEWIGVIGKRVWKLKQGDDSIFYESFEHNVDPKRQHCSSLSHEIEEHTLKDYFQLNVSLKDLYRSWGEIDKNFESLADEFDGIRMLRQDPVENLFSFICSQNNHITRISSMVEKLCVNYGVFICNIDGREYYSFPSLLSLSGDDVETKLRDLGFGYRAKFIHNCARKILNDQTEKWLYDLRNVSYKEAHQALCELPGVGAKVADCVCLMSLDKTEAIPVDTHMWQIAKRDYLPHLHKYKTLTDKIYQEIGDHFRSIYGEYAGWAHSVLFSADLKRFQELKQKSLTKKQINHLLPGEEAQKKKAKEPNNGTKNTNEVHETQMSEEQNDEKLPKDLMKKVLKRKSARLATKEVEAKLQKSD